MILFGQVPAHAQVHEPVPAVTIDLKQVGIEEVFLEMEKQTGLFFSYESSLLDDIPKISFRANDESLSYCLRRLLSPYSIIWRITGGNIILKRKPRQYTVSGFVRDSASYESLINATVVERGSGKGVVSNSFGFYSITLPAGKTVLRSSYVGYQTREIVIDLQKDTLVDIPLSMLGALQEVVVRGANPHSDVLSSRMGNIELTPGHISKVPVLFGEPDLLRTLQQLPGVAAGTEIFGSMFVRGGNSDENLFLIDGIPVYNVNHVGGLFSTFNPDVVHHVDFYKGGFPARYGGRLSSVVDVRLKDGDMKEYHGNATIGLLAAKASFEGPLVKDRTSFNVAFRRTWFDAFTAPFFAIMNGRNKYGRKIFAGYSFYDLNGKINHIFSHRSRLYANFYMGQDRLRVTDWTDYGDDKYGQELIWRWGNLVTSLNWTYVFNRKMFANFNASYSRYSSKMIDDRISTYLLTGWNGNRLPLKEVYSFQGSGIEDAGIRMDFDYSPHVRHRIRFGSDFFSHRYRPEKKWKDIIIRDSLETKLYQGIYTDPLVHAYEWGVYAEDDWLIGERWKASIGGRFSAYHVDNKMYNSFQPRVSLRYLLRRDLSLKASYVRMSQYIHQLSNTYASLPSDIWVPVTAKVKPMNSAQYSLGVYYNLKKTYDFSIEGYYKEIDNLIEYQDNALLFPDYAGWDEKISMGSGRSYGAELMARKPEGRTSGWIAYTLSWSDRIFNDRMVNGGKRFPAKYDNRHKLNVTLIHKISSKVDISASWTFASGNRATVPLDYYISHPSEITVPPEWGESNPLPVRPQENILGRNAAKLGDYHRLDLSLNVYRPKKNGRMGIWNVSVYNAYSRKNPFYIEYTLPNATGKYTASQKGLIPVIPSISYTFKF